MDAHRYHIQGPQHKNETKPMARVSRLARELELLRTDPPPGVAAWLVDEADLSRFHASIQGPESTPYAAGLFRLELEVSARYPFEPPKDSSSSRHVCSSERRRKNEGGTAM
eukprot:evm.model.NODE_32581_length_16376_cov_18.250671.5